MAAGHRLRPEDGATHHAVAKLTFPVRAGALDAAGGELGAGRRIVRRHAPDRCRERRADRERYECREHGPVDRLLAHAVDPPTVDFHAVEAIDGGARVLGADGDVAITVEGRDLNGRVDVVRDRVVPVRVSAPTEGAVGRHPARHHRAGSDRNELVAAGDQLGVHGAVAEVVSELSLLPISPTDAVARRVDDAGERRASRNGRGAKSVEPGSEEHGVRTRAKAEDRAPADHRTAVAARAGEIDARADVGICVRVWPRRKGQHKDAARRRGGRRFRQARPIGAPDDEDDDERDGGGEPASIEARHGRLQCEWPEPTPLASHANQSGIILQSSINRSFVSFRPRAARHILIDTHGAPAQVGGPSSRLHMRSLSGFVLAAAVAGASFNAHPAAAQVDARTLREPTVSATQIAFIYGGDIWIMPKAGGTAQRLTTARGEESFPHFSPDGATIAFTADYDGNDEVYTIPAAGGEATRLTYHPSADRVVAWYPDGQSLLIASGRTSETNRYNKLFKISKTGGLPTVLPMPYGEFASFSPDAKTVAYLPEAVDARTWKRYRGGWAPDIWTFDLATHASKNITHDNANDAQPMWHGSTLYFLTDRGTNERGNIWAYDTKTDKFRQVTDFGDYDVKYPWLGPSDIVFQAGDRMYLLDLATEKSHEVPVKV